MIAVKYKDESSKSDGEILDNLKERFAMLADLTEEAIMGNSRSLIVTGPPGIGKTYSIEQKLRQLKAVWASVSGGISPVGLYKLAYANKMKGNVILIDDGDEVFRDEDSLNITKAMTDTKEKRIISWRKDSRSLLEDDVEKSFVYSGSLIMASNVDFQRYVDEGKSKNAAHMAAMISRSYYIDMHFRDSRALSIWIKHVALDGRMFERENVPLQTGVDILVFLYQNRTTIREYSLRSVKLCCDLTKMKGDWRKKALISLCR